MTSRLPPDSVSDRDSQFIIAQAAQTKKGNGKYGYLGEGIYDGCPTLDVNSWTPCQVSCLVFAFPRVRARARARLDLGDETN